MNFSKRDFAFVVNALGYPWRSSKGQSDTEGPSPNISTQRPMDPKAAKEKCWGGGDLAIPELPLWLLKRGQ